MMQTMKKSKKTQVNKLDQKEKEFLSSFEQNEWKTVKNIEKEKKQARKSALSYLKSSE